MAFVSEDLCVDERVYDEFIRRLDHSDDEGGKMGKEKENFRLEYWPLYPQMMRSVLIEWERRGSGRWVDFDRKQWKWQMKELEKRFGRRIELGSIWVG